jgi:hypothetical protein
MTGWLRLRIMCPCGVTCLPPCGATCLPACGVTCLPACGATCLPADCFSELSLLKDQSMLV